MRSVETSWAREEFGGIQAGDVRRSLRIVQMATRAAERPSGKISEVFAHDSERQGAYDLLETGKVPVASLLSAMSDAALA